MLDNYPNDILSVKELCDILQIGRNSAYDLLQSNTIHSRRLNRKYIIPKDSVIKYIKDIVKND
jgi:excisionase family DNA binding protein